MKLIYVIILLEALHTATSQHSPSITFISENQSTDIGSNVEIQCSVRYTDKNIVRWMKIYEGGESKIITEGLISKDPRMTVEYDNSRGAYTLQIKNFQESDVGLYRCVLLVSLDDTRMAEMYLQARVPPRIVDFPTEVMGHRGMSLMMECYAEGSPEPRISWWRGNNLTLENDEIIYIGSVLKIEHVIMYDEGVYFCQADNGVGRPDVRQVILRVSHPPTIFSDHKKVYQRINSTATLSCRVEAFPSPKIVWKRRNIELVNDDRHTIVSSHLNDNFVLTCLHVFFAKRGQNGQYTCHATNEMGERSLAISLHEFRNGSSYFHSG